MHVNQTSASSQAGRQAGRQAKKRVSLHWGQAKNTVVAVLAYPRRLDRNLLETTALSTDPMPEASLMLTVARARLRMAQMDKAIAIARDAFAMLKTRLGGGRGGWVWWERGGGGRWEVGGVPVGWRG